MVKYNHAYTIAFSLVNENEDGTATDDELIQAILRRVADCIEHNELQEAVGGPFDTFEEDT